MNNYISFNIKYLCNKNNLTQNDFGELFNLGKSVVSMYVAEKSIPKIDTIQKICTHFEITIDDFINRKLDGLDNATSKVAEEPSLLYSNKPDEQAIQLIVNTIVQHQEDFYNNPTFKMLLERDIAKGVNEELLRIVKDKSNL